MRRLSYYTLPEYNSVYLSIADKYEIYSASHLVQISNDPVVFFVQILTVTVRTRFNIAGIKACTARGTAYGGEREAELGRRFDTLPHMHSVFVGLAFYFSFRIMQAVKIKEDIHIAYHVFNIAAYYAEIVKPGFDDISRLFGTTAFTAGKFRRIFAVNSHSEQRCYLIAQVFG